MKKLALCVVAVCAMLAAGCDIFRDGDKARLDTPRDADSACWVETHADCATGEATVG